MLTALIIFLATYLFIAGAELPFLKLDRPGGAVAGGVAMALRCRRCRTCSGSLSRRTRGASPP